MTRRFKKTLPIGLISFVGLLLVLTVTVWCVAQYLEGKVKYALIKEVEKSTEGLFKLQIGKIKINPTNGTLRINDVYLLVDSTKLYRLEAKGERLKYTANITAKSVVVDVNKLLKIRKGGKLDIKHISIVEPKVSLTSSSTQKQDYRTNIKEKKDTELPFFSSAIIGKIQITNGSIHHYNEGSKDTTLYSIEDFSIDLKNIIIDSVINLRNPLSHVDNALLEVNNMQYGMLDNALLFRVKKLSANLKESSASIDSLTITPQYEKYEFARKSPNHNDIIDLSIKSTKLSGVHFSQLVNENILVIDSIIVDSLSFWSFKNKQIPPLTLKEKPLFYQTIQRLPIPLAIANIAVNNSNVSYEELSINGKYPGKINFTNLMVEIDGLTNIVTDKNQLYTIKGYAKVFDKGELNATLRFPIDSLNDYFEVSGYLGKMDLVKINQMITPLAHAEVKSGHVQRMDFSITGNSKTAKTDMTFLYNDLEVEILNAKKKGHSKRKLLSGVVNTLLIKSNNPSGNGKPRMVTNAVSERNRSLSNFNYWWQGIRKGITGSLGIPGK